MPDQPNPQQQIEKPASATPAVAEPAMFVMPEEYRHGATGKKMATPAAAQAPKPAIAPPPPVPVRPPAAKKKGLPRNIKVLLAAGGVLILGLAVAGFLVIRSLEPAAVVPEERPAPTTRPPPVVEPPVVEPEPVEETPTETESPFPTAKTPGTDTDSDGLTDLEERLVYGTNPSLPDTDSDGFLDGNEVYHRYNPAGTAPGTLFESGLAKLESAAEYRVLYPSIWAADDGTFKATTGETFVLLVENTERAAFDDWYAAQDFAKGFDKTTTKNGYASYVEDDGLMVLVRVPTGEVVTLRYDTGIKATVDYLQTFKMMANSLEWLTSAQN